MTALVAGPSSRVAAGLVCAFHQEKFSVWDRILRTSAFRSNPNQRAAGGNFPARISGASATTAAFH